MYKYIFLFFPFFLFAQYSPKEIDSLMTTEVYRLRDENNNQAIVSLSKKVIQDSKKINYQKGEIYGFARLGNALCNLNNYKEALKVLNNADYLIEISKIEDYVIKTSINLGVGRCYLESKTSYKNAINQFDKALFFAKKIQNYAEKKKYLSIIYGNYYSAYSNLGNEEKAAFYLKKGLSLKEDAYALIGLARYHNTHTLNSDSARYYLNRGDKIIKNDFDKAALYSQWGRYYEEKGEYNKAIEFYKKAEILALKIDGAGILDVALSGLQFTYEKMGNAEQSLVYSKKRILLKDSINKVQSKSYDITINDVLKKKEKNINQKFSNTKKIYIAFSILALLIVIFFGIRIYKNKKENKKVIELMEQKEVENLELQQKLNKSFEEVVQLAKDNNPEFITRFKEVYPEFYSKLISIEPKLLDTEIKLCAMLFLGFSAKDIAEFTFVTVKAAQHRKFRLRKKLNIPSDEEINSWILKEY